MNNQLPAREKTRAANRTLSLCTPAWQADFIGQSLPPGFSFSRAGTGSVLNSSGVLHNAASNVPRMSFRPVTHAPRGLLLEGSRTNIQTYAEQLDTTSAWSALTAATVTANAATAPDGASSMDKLAETTATSAHWVTANNAVSNGSTYTLSVYAKAAERSVLQMFFGSAGFGSNAWANFDLAGGSIGSVGSAASARMTNIGGGLYRCEITAPATASGSNNMFGLCLQTSTSATRLASHAGTAGSGLYLWGMQFEQAPFASSYIATTMAAATRAADLATVTALADTGFNPAQGTWVAEAEFEGVSSLINQRVLQADDGSGNNRLLIGLVGTGLRAICTAGGIDTATLNLSTASANTVYKIAFGYRANSFAAAVNGGAAVTAASGALPSGLSTLRLGRDSAAGSNFYGWLRRAAYYPVRLPDNVLSALSA